MTATTPRRRGPPTPVGGPSLVRRHGIVYGIPILDPTTMVIRTDYVGQTVQPLQTREDQHRGRGRDPGKEQPWSDLIVGRAFVIEAGIWTTAELDERERHHIQRLRPRFNFEHNGSNPDRIPIYEARRQRAERDRAAGVVSRWSAPDRFGGSVRRVVPLPAGRHPAVVVLSSRFTWWAVAYLAAAAASWWLLARVGVVLGGWWHLGLACALPVVVVLLGWWWWATVGRRRWRRLRRWVR